MNQRASTAEQVLTFVPKEKAQNKVPQVDEAGQAIVAQIRTAVKNVQYERSPTAS